MHSEAISYLQRHFVFSGKADANLDVSIAAHIPMPALDPVFVIPERLVSFSDVPKGITLPGYVHDSEAGVHFYIDDYRFHCIMTHTDRYISILENYKCVFTPDVSLYRDMELNGQIINSYHGKAVGRLMQDAGICVIPTVSWSDERSFSFCFEGLPSHSVVSISSVGISRDKEAMRLFELGYNEMIRRLEPSTILLYGPLLKMNFGNVPIRQYDNTNFVWTKTICSSHKEVI